MEFLDEEENGKAEQWLDKHDHKMAFIRTTCAIIAALAGVAVVLKVYGIT